MDYTASMEVFSRVRQLADLCGYIVCAKSPSCGMARVRICEAQGVQKTGVGGLFTRILLEQMPWLPVEEDGRLQYAQLHENFVARIFSLGEFNQLMLQPLTRDALMAFHRRYKLLLLAHSQPAYRRIWPLCRQHGPLVVATRVRPGVPRPADGAAAPSGDPVQPYYHVHDACAGTFYRYLTRAQRSELTGLIDSYCSGFQSLLAPIMLLKHYIAEYPNAWLAQQRYFEPYHEALRLRYGH